MKLTARYVFTHTAPSGDQQGASDTFRPQLGSKRQIVSLTIAVASSSSAKGMTESTCRKNLLLRDAPAVVGAREHGRFDFAEAEDRRPIRPARPRFCRWRSWPQPPGSRKTSRSDCNSFPALRSRAHKRRTVFAAIEPARSITELFRGGRQLDGIPLKAEIRAP